MHAAEVTIPAPAFRRNARRVAATATAATALVLAAAGTVALAANALRDAAGYFNWPAKTFTSRGYAIAMKTVDISKAPTWVFGDAGLSGVRVEARGDQPLFIGIAHTADLDRYLHGTAHDDVSGLSYHPFRVDYDHADGYAPLRAPADESFWAKSTSGTGNLALSWKPRRGNWRAVIMNADGSRGVISELRFGARTSLLWWLGAALLAASVLAAAVAGVLYRKARAR